MFHRLIYGGTFDPIHHGHLIPCRRARELLGADGVLLIPANLSPHKIASREPQGATTSQRLDMLRLAIADEPGFAIDKRELSREGPSYTIDTLRELVHDAGPARWTLLLGSDQLPKFHTWRSVKEILTLCDVAILPRPRADAEAGLTLVRHGLGEVAERVVLLDTPVVDISATDIRERVRRGLSIRYLVPAAVEAYLLAQRIYRTDDIPG